MPESTRSSPDDEAWQDLEAAIAATGDALDRLEKAIAPMGVSFRDVVWELTVLRSAPDVSPSPGHRRVHELVDRQPPGRSSCRWCGAGVWCPCDPLLPQACAVYLIPLERGGTLDDDNLALACEACAAAKGNLTVDEWRPAS